MHHSVPACVSLAMLLSSFFFCDPYRSNGAGLRPLGFATNTADLLVFYIGFNGWDLIAGS